MSRIRTSIPAVGFVAAIAVACGGAAVPPEPVPDADAPHPLAGSGEGMAEIVVAELPVCPIDLDLIATTGAQFSYRLPPAEEAWLRVWAARVDETGALVFEFEQRDETGSNRGTEAYVCDRRGLALRCAQDDVGTLCFDPPLLVLPLVGNDGAAAGSATFDDGESESVFDYRFAFDAAGAEPRGVLQDEPGRWRSVHSVLLLDDGEVEHEWATESLWLVRATAIGAVRRRTEVRDSNGSLRIIEEEARTVSGD